MTMLQENIYDMPGIIGILFRNYRKDPNRTVIKIGDNSITYEELIRKGTCIASGLYEMGIRKGDRVGLLIPNSVNWYIFMFGILRLGAVVVPFDPQMGEYEIKYLFDRVGIRTVLVPEKYRGLYHHKILYGLKESLPDLKKVIVDGNCVEDDFHMSFNTLLNCNCKNIPNLILSREDSNIFFCTTGSTGNPKIVDIPCRIVNDNMEKNAQRWGFVEGDKFFLSMPLYHAAGFGWGLSSLSAGGSIYYEENFSPTIYLNKIQSEHLSKMLLTPTIAKILLTHPKFKDFDISSMKQLVFTGEYLSDELSLKFVNEFNMRIVNALGMTETFVYLDWDSIRDSGISANNLGTIPGIDVRIVDEDGNEVKNGETGLINIKNSVMKGYFRLEEVTKDTIDKDGWLNSGDLAVIGDDRRVKFIGRKKRVIKRGGNLVSPEEIEQFLRTHSQCAAVIVDSEPDSVIGEKIIAYIQPAEGKKLVKEDIISFCKGKISAYKIPDEIYFINEVPKTVGKVNPTLLKKLKENNELI